MVGGVLRDEVGEADTLAEWSSLGQLGAELMVRRQCGERIIRIPTLECENAEEGVGLVALGGGWVCCGGDALRGRSFECS
jgi:hypothetical protein